jgi:hypothetical protein
LLVAVDGKLRKRGADAILCCTLCYSVSLSLYGLRHNTIANLSLTLIHPDGTSVSLLHGNCYGLALGATSAASAPDPYSFAPYDGQARGCAHALRW